MTWSPFFTLVTPGPTSTTMPAPSWPRMAGNSPSGEREFVRVTDAGGLHLDQDFGGFRALQLDFRDRERLALFQCNGGAGCPCSFPPRHLGWHALSWRTHGKRSPPGAKSRGRCSGGEDNSRMKSPTHPSQRWRSGARMGSGPRTMRTPRSRKNFKYRWKSITQRSLTEIERSRKNAAAPEGGI